MSYCSRLEAGDCDDTDRCRAYGCRYIEQPLSSGASRRVIVREPDETEMDIAGSGEAKAFAKQLIRDGKGFEATPQADGVWRFIVYELNEPSRWEVE